MKESQDITNMKKGELTNHWKLKNFNFMLILILWYGSIYWTLLHVPQSTGSPLAKTLVVISTFSLPSRKRSSTAILWSTVRSPDSSATAWPSRDIFSASHDAVLRVCTYTSNKQIAPCLKWQKQSFCIFFLPSIDSVIWSFSTVLHTVL